MKGIIDRIRLLWQKEPARVTVVATFIVGFILSKLHFVLDPATLGQYVLIGLGLIFGGETVRANVSPVGQDPGDPAFDPSLIVHPGDVKPDEGNSGAGA